MIFGYSLVLISLVISLIVQINIKSTYSRYRDVRSDRNISGAEAARRILDANGLYNVQIQQIGGELTDHFDPRTNVVSLSTDVFHGTSLASVGVAAHEVGHAIQHAQGYAPIRIRSAIVPVTNIGSRLFYPVILLGMILGMPQLLDVGIILFSLVVVFQFVTLPVEFNASSRALASLEQLGILGSDELHGSRKVLSAAALTYVAALVTSLLQLIRLLALRNRR
ncbi:MAG: zinc metallopeptidase [Ruminococcus sp.]|nr:zinc metallopeptidase [Ruminococcus sp.]MBQ8906144.1 zinc metallopeptidase [Ruminococcus sp.]